MTEYYGYKNNPKRYEAVSSFDYKGHLGEVHDMAVDPIPASWHNADCIYSEISWRVGYPIFMERAGVEGKFEEYLKGIEALIFVLGKPTFLIGSVLDMKKMNAEHIVPVTFKTVAMPNGWGYCGIWNAERLDVVSHVDVLLHIKSLFKRVLDFSCGYLSILDVLLPDVKFLLGDINPVCIGASYQRLKGYYVKTN